MTNIQATVTVASSLAFPDVVQAFDQNHRLSTFEGMKTRARLARGRDCSGYFEYVCPR